MSPNACARGLTFAILHFVAVKKSRRENTFALSETVRSEVVSLLPLSVRQPIRAGGTYGAMKAKPVAPCCRRLCLFESLSFMPSRRFPPPWSVEELDACFIVIDSAGQKLAFIYFEDEPGRRAAAKLKDAQQATAGP